MKSIQSMIAVAAIAFTLPAQAATGDPEIILYRASGVIDNGGSSGAGVATVIQCTNISPVTENIRWVVRNFNGIIAANVSASAASFQTLTASTHFTNLYGGGLLNTGAVNPGTMAIAATTSNVFCTARTVDAAATIPSGIVLPMIRYNPIAGSEE